MTAVRPRLFDNFDEARSIRETFVDRDAKRVKRFSWTWPSTFEEIGTGLSVAYTSDKWQEIGEYDDYKHIAEAPQAVLCRPGCLVDYHHRKKKVPVCAVPFRLPSPMPEYIAELAPLLNFQVALYECDGKQPVLPARPRIMQVEFRYGMLGGAKLKTGEPFLVVYTKAGGPEALIFGRELDVEQDGIVG